MEPLLTKIAPLVEAYYRQTLEPSAAATKTVRLSAPAFDHREAMRAFSTILGGWISQGKNVREFESAYARYIGCASGIATNSGSSANLIALHALKEQRGLQDGDEVIVPAATFATVSMPIVQAGLVPVYVDVDKETLNISADEVEKAISDRTRILMPVHTLGYPAEMNDLLEIANRHGLAVLEDCCEAHGSMLDGGKVGSFGHIGTFSFFVAHNMTTGEGGMVVTNDDALEIVCRSYREFGRYNNEATGSERFYSDEVLTDYDVRYVFERLGFNMRMTDVTAAFGIEQLAKLDAMNDQRRANAAFLTETLDKEVGNFLATPKTAPGRHHTYYTYPIVLRNEAAFSRRAFAEHLEALNIETRPLFAGCLPDQPAFRNAPGRNVGDLINSRILRDKLIFVGIHPGINQGDLEYMADAIVSFVKDHT